MMVTPFPVNTRPKRPSERVIAFAISLVLSKPEGVSIKEYIPLLRQHIAKGRREKAVSSVYRHLDRSSYWRSEYERVKAALRASEGESVDLRREIDRLKAKAEAAKTRPGTSPGKKRKKVVDEDVILAPRDPKKAKRDVSPSRRPGVGEVDVERDFDFADVGEIGNILMRNLYQVHALLKSHHRSEPATLAHHLVRSASALPQVVQAAVKASFVRTLTGPEVLKRTLTAACRAVASLIVGINRLGHIPGGTEVQGHVIYAYVQMFSNLVNLLEEASDFEAKRPPVQETASLEKKTVSKTKAKAHQPKAVTLKDVPPLNAIACFLCGIVDLLDPNDGTHKQLFEGFAYCALNKLGARLYTCVFGHARDATIEIEIARSTREDEIEDDDAAVATARPGDELEVKKAKLEAPYLIHLLTRLMATAPAHMGTIISSKTGKAKHANTKGSFKGALNVAAKDRLQRTLVNCMFGEEGVDGGDRDEFRDALKMPSPIEKPLPVPKVKEIEVCEWFKEEVWRLLGWEILGKEGEW